MADHPVPEPKLSNLQGSSSGAESDLGELAALFASHGGEGLSAELSAELALEVVLNEIVEQACLTTGATGAAIVLLRDGEMVCRASSGANVPQVGARLGSESGLTAECTKTREVQRCDDAQTDPRADAAASRNLGVRSVMIYPLLRKGELAGLLEVFSPRLGAFGDRDEGTLQGLAQRILKNLERASEPLSLPGSSAKSAVVEDEPAEPILPSAIEAEKSWAGSAMGLNILNNEENTPLETGGRSARAGFDFFSLALGAVVVVCALLLGTLVGVRLGWRRAAVRGAVMKSGSGAGVRAQDPTQNMVAQSGAAQAGGELATSAASASASTGAGNAGPADTPSKIEEKRNALAPASKPPAPPAGTLLVYENGKEIFRLPPAGEGGAATGSSEAQVAVPGEVQRASAVEPAGTAPVEGSLLHRVEPEYPEQARQQRIQGAVVVNVRIGRDGAIQDVKLVSGQAVLANAAIAAVRQWRFKPRVVNGKPVQMQTKVTLNFRLPS